MQQVSRGEFGRLAIGCTSSAALHPAVPRLLRSFHAYYPLIEVEAREDTTSDLLDALDEGRLDAAFVRFSSRRYPQMKSVTLDNEQMIVALPADYLLARQRGTVALSALVSEAFVLYRRSDGPGVQDIMSGAFRKAGITPDVIAEVPRLLSALTLVTAGRGITLVPEALKTVHQESVSYRMLDEISSFSILLNLVYRECPADALISRFARIA